MQIDFFTFFAQIVNFLILIYLLRRFLYGPITRAMAGREGRIAARFAAAEAQKQQAEQEGEQYRAQRRELAEKRDELLAEVRIEASDLRKAMVQDVRQDVEALRAQWYEALEHERYALLQELRTRISQQVMFASRRTLAHLANADLEQAIVDSFLEQIKQLGPQPRPAYMPQDQTTAEQLVVRSSFALSVVARRKLSAALQAHYNGAANGTPPPIRFEQSEDLICGIEVEGRDRRIGWNVSDYLTTLEETVDHTMVTASPTFQAGALAPIRRNEEGLFLA